MNSPEGGMGGQDLFKDTKETINASEGFMSRILRKRREKGEKKEAEKISGEMEVGKKEKIKKQQWEDDNKWRQENKFAPELGQAIVIFTKENKFNNMWTKPLRKEYYKLKLNGTEEQVRKFEAKIKEKEWGFILSRGLD